MKRLTWSRTAQRQLFAIADYYIKFDPELPEVMLERIEQAPLLLLDFPDIGSPTSRHGVRKWRAKGTPFLIYYRVRGSTIQIQRVIHARSDGA